MQKGKMVAEEPLQIAEKRREAKGKGQKERYSHVYAEFQRIARRDTKAGIKIARRNINNLKYAYDTILMAESKEELKGLLIKVKENSEKLA